MGCFLENTGWQPYQNYPSSNHEQRRMLRKNLYLGLAHEQYVFGTEPYCQFLHPPKEGAKFGHHPHIQGALRYLTVWQLHAGIQTPEI